MRADNPGGWWRRLGSTFASFPRPSPSAYVVGSGLMGGKLGFLR